jgi:hypothetical protein
VSTFFIQFACSPNRSPGICENLNILVRQEQEKSLKINDLQAFLVF